MNRWKIEYAKDQGKGRFKMVESDMVRVANANEDIWFCNYKDKDHQNHFIPKFILAKGTYLSVERIDEPTADKTGQPTPTEVFKKSKAIFAKEAPMDWI